MNKKVMALAVAGVLTAPAAFAQSSNVQLYGRAVLGIDNWGADGASGGQVGNYENRMRIFDNSSRVGLRGTEDLGNGLKAIFQIETGVAIDSGQAQGAGGQANASKGTWATRDSFVGLDSGFGRLTFGRQSIYWANGELAQFSANYINTEIPWTNGTQLGRISRPTAGAGPVARQSNTMQYTTPTFAGFNATLSYSPNAQEPVGTNSPLGTDVDGAVYGATVRGAFGPVYGQFDWVQNEANSPNAGTFTPEFTGYKAGIGWKYLPGANVSFIWVRSETNNALGVTGGNEVTQNGYTVNWEHTFGNIQALAQYGWTDNMKGCSGAVTATNWGCDNTKSTAFMIGARYLLSKRTWIFASWNQIDNKSNQYADFVGDSYTSAPTGSTIAQASMGADPEVWAFGVFHAF
jgi:predicted porin